MGYSLHVPLPGGRLKIKSKSRLRSREAEGKVPVKKLLGLYLIWESREERERIEREQPPMF
ncbi:MAG: hypothetical protein KDJ30_14620 [Rhodoblastus sp.]|nr:hypothetical protein [Rhodoblastus sp.]